MGNSTLAQNEQILVPVTDVVSISAGLTPANPFYFLDRLGEILREFFTFNPESKAKLYVEFSRERVAEISVMLKEKDIGSSYFEKAKALLLGNVSDAAKILDEEKSKNKNVSQLAKILNDEFDAGDVILNQSFKNIKDQLESQAKDIESLIGIAQISGNVSQVSELELQLADINQQIDILQQEKDQLKNSLQTEQNEIENDMDENDQIQEKLEQQQDNQNDNQEELDTQDNEDNQDNQEELDIQDNQEWWDIKEIKDNEESQDEQEQNFRGNDSED